MRANGFTSASTDLLESPVGPIESEALLRAIAHGPIEGNAREWFHFSVTSQRTVFFN